MHTRCMCLLLMVLPWSVIQVCQKHKKIDRIYFSYCINSQTGYCLYLKDFLPPPFELARPLGILSQTLIITLTNKILSPFLKIKRIFLVKNQQSVTLTKLIDKDMNIWTDYLKYIL